MPSEAWEDTGVRDRLRLEPDGLDRRCLVCKADVGAYCVNPITGRPRRQNVSCLGRKERTS